MAVTAKGIGLTIPTASSNCPNIRNACAGKCPRFQAVHATRNPPTHPPIASTMPNWFSMFFPTVQRSDA